MKEFWLDFRNSVYGPDFYAAITARPLSSSFGYFFLLTTILTFIATIGISIRIIPQAVTFLNNVSDQALNYYPDKLEITAKGGQISTNVTEPYFFTMPKEFKTASSDFDNLLVIDTKSTFSVKLFEQYKTAALLTKDSIVAYNKGAIQIQSLDKVPDGTLNKAKVASIFSTVRSYFKFVPGVLVVAIFIGMFFVRSLNLLYLVFGALVILLILRIGKVKAGYAESYQIGLHAMTPSMLVSTFFMVTPATGIPFLFSIIFIIVLIANLKGRLWPKT